MVPEPNWLTTCWQVSTWRAAAEVMALSERMGLDLTTTLNVIEQSSGQSWIGNDRMRRAIADDFEPRAHTTLLAKDTKLAVAAASKLGFKTPLGKLTTETFARALAHGLAEQDDASLYQTHRAMTTDNLSNSLPNAKFMWSHPRDILALRFWLGFEPFRTWHCRHSLGLVDVFAAARPYDRWSSGRC